MAKETPSFIRDALHILILFLLLIVLLVIVTRFKIVHPSVVPGWQGVYCTYISESLGQKHSSVAFLYSKDGSGNPQQLVEDLSKFRPEMRTELFKAEDVSGGILSRYEVVVLERTRTVPFKTISALESYISSGGSIIWTADALSNQTLDSRDLEEARLQNLSKPDFAATVGRGKDYYTWFVEHAQDQQGFGDFGDKYLGAFLETKTASPATEFSALDKNHFILAGIRAATLGAGTKFAVVNQNPDANMIATIKHGSDTFPGILEVKLQGRLIYMAFPLEALNSTTFIDNVFDYLVTC